MTYRDDEQSHAPNPPHAMIGGARPQDALVPQTNGVPPANIYSFGPTPPAVDVLRGGMDVNWLLNCLRRRWMLAICMGLVAGVTTAGALWLLFPETSSATALFNVSSKKPSVLEHSGSEIREFEILQRTQLAYLKSHFVLYAAVRDPAIASLGILAGKEPVEWLIEELSPSFQQNSEILSISLTGDSNQSEDLRKLVDAVSDAYQKEVVFAEDQRRFVTRDALARSFTKLSDEIKGKMEQYNALAKELGVTPDARQRDPESELLMREIADSMKTKADIEGRLAELQTDFLVIREQLKDPRIIDEMVDEQLAADPQMSIMNNELLGYQYQAASQGSVMKRGRSREGDRLQKQINVLQQRIAQYREQVKQQLLNDQKSRPDQALQAANREFQIRAGVLNSQRQTLEKAMQEKTEKLLAKGEQSVDLDVLAAELDQLNEIARDMNVKLESFDIEAVAEKRIRKIQDAIIIPGINASTRYTITTIGGLGAFALACFGIAYLEFCNRRLNGPEQVDEGLGIRVVGTLPALSASRVLDPDHPIVAQLTESIDSVRTQLMHDSTSKRRQVVMVTSAVAMEGRTTVASQLAASLARAGRRTLLVDGDVRRPALHALFDVPLEDGLCEVLRAEVDVADVIRPTHAEGLWLLTAGYCDIDAIQALATEQIQPVFEKLRGEYDFVIIDGAPVLGMSDALIFGQYCDGAILSVRRDFSRMPKINETAHLLRSVGVRLIGSVVNGVPTKPDDRVTQLRLIAPKSERLLEAV